MTRSLQLFLLLTALSVAAAPARRVVFIAGPPSHGPREHEYRAGCLLLAGCLANVPDVSTLVLTNGWPSNARVLDGADTLVIYTDGGPGHPLIQPGRLSILSPLMAKGLGLVCLHYAVEPIVPN